MVSKSITPTFAIFPSPKSALVAFIAPSVDMLPVDCIAPLELMFPLAVMFAFKSIPSGENSATSVAESIS